MLLADLIADRAHRTPDAAAILAPGSPTLTFLDLRRHVEKTARRLAAAGVGPTDRVAIVLPNGPEMATAFLAIASCCASAPLNPGYRRAEFDFYLDDLDAAVLLVPEGSDSPAIDAARDRDIPVLRITVDPRDPAGVFGLSRDGQPLAEADAAARPGPGDEALILHTSGTTSRPKMVPLTQTNVVRSAQSIVETLALTPTDRCLNVMPLFHIHGLVAAVLSSVAAGASVVATPGFDATRFFAWMDEFAPTWYTAVPTMHQGLLARAGRHADVIAARPLRFIRSCSASLPPSVMADLENTFGAPVVEAYGMTEAAHQMSCNPLPPLARKPGSVGPAAGPEVAIMDETSGRLLAAGETGEVVIRGDNVTPGYANNPEANASSFTDGWFRTGDQGRLDDDGYLFLTGRLKEMINRAGENVSPREIDEVLLDHPAVAQALCFAVPDPRVGEEIAAALVLSPGAVLDERQLLAFAARRLADHKLPRKFVVLDAIPKGPTGKLQRIGLAEKLGLGGEAGETVASSGPRTEVERALGEAAAAILEVDAVGPADDFFALGGDSILATRFVLAAGDILGRNLPVHALFLRPTIEGLIEHAAALPPERGPTTSGLAEGEDGPTTLAQDMLWLHERLLPGTAVNHRPGGIRIEGKLDPARLRHALGALTTRHAALRARLPARGSRLVMVIDPPGPVDLEMVEGDRAFADEFVRRPFDLETGPLARFALVRRGPESHRLLLNVHHAVFDAWSMSVLVRDLGRMLAGEEPGPMPTISCADLAAWERRRESDGAFDEALEWWHERLQGATRPPLPRRDGADPDSTESAARVVETVIPAPVARAVEARGRAAGLTPFMTYLTVFDLVVARWCDTEEVVLGTLVSGRDRPGAENLVGLLVNEIVLRTDLAGVRGFDEAMDRVRADVREAFAHQEIPYPLVIRSLRPPVRLGRNPLFDVLFQMKPFPPARMEAGGLRLVEEDMFAGTARYDVFVELAPGQDGVAGRFEFRSSQFDSSTLDDLILRWRSAIAAVSAGGAR